MERGRKEKAEGVEGPEAGVVREVFVCKGYRPYLFFRKEFLERMFFWEGLFLRGDFLWKQNFWEEGGLVLERLFLIRFFFRLMEFFLKRICINPIPNPLVLPKNPYQNPSA